MDSSNMAKNPDNKSGVVYPPPPYQDVPQNPFPQGGMAQGQYPAGPQTAVPVTTTVYVTQAPLAYPLPDYLGYSIFTMLCCCLPLGIAALVYSISTRDANNRGQQDLAQRSSNRARNLNHAALGIGITFLILWIVYVAVISTRH